MSARPLPFEREAAAIAREPWIPDTVTPTLSDVGNAERLVARHGSDLRYCAALGAWYVWDERRWRRDDTGEVVRRAVETIRSLYGEAELLASRRAREDLVKHALRSEGATKIAAMVELAQANARVAVRADAFDADPWLLTVLNGTIDLRVGELRPHRSQDLVTRLAPVEFDPDARLELWDSFLFQATGGDADLLRYLERAAGYSLTGDTSEEVLFLVHGPTASGKSTMLEALKATMGEYATTADFDTFASGRRDAGPRNDIARLAGRRFVVSIEMEEGRRLAEGLVKMLTGGDTVAARFLYKEAIEFRPTAKLWFGANAKPRVSDDDAAIWRRIRLVPFEHTIPEAERDPNVKAQLRDPLVGGPAILAWAVRGCREWQRDGLRAPERVTRATQGYREEMDPLAAFIEERCVVDDEASTPAANLYLGYVEWGRASGERRILTSREFGLRLTSRGITADKGARGLRIRRGLRLRTNEPELELERGEVPI